MFEKLSKKKVLLTLL